MRRAFAIALAVAAIGLTRGASADIAPAPAPATSASPPESGTPLALRPTKPLELAREPARPGIEWKIGAIVLVLGCAAFYARRKFSSKHREDAQLTIVRRATVGFRSELVVVNVEGQRLLLGVTPHSIQSLALLDGEDAAPGVAPSASAAASSLGDRFSAMLDAADRPAARARSPRPESAPNKVASPAAGPLPDEESDVGSQARGLLALRRPR